MKTNQLKTIILALNDPVLVQAALDLLRKGQPLTAIQSGTVAYAEPDGSGPWKNSFDMAQPPIVFFDGFNYCVWLFYVSG